ncbi:DUF4123 domain-containing protein [Montanilutibacter psychrotolerans]|uniref:DUF4123 domain-containing protein n=1 Tax=Montanilutibacter psychrotolerans TaxID=1327343 RepID=UPI0016815C82|nr:DUF4123 domain-containing protein [Lysobacter psychrotolerans]
MIDPACVAAATLDASLRQRAKTGQRVYALFESGLADPRRWKRTIFLHALTSLYEGRYNGEGLTEISPSLCELPTDPVESERWLSAILDACRGQPMLAFIVTALSRDELVRHLQQRMEAASPPGEHFVARWADTRCLASWVAVLDDAQRAHFTAGIDAWLYFDRCGQLQSLPLETTVSPGHHDLAYRLTWEQIRRLQRSAMADTVLDYLRARSRVFGRLSGLPSVVHATAEKILLESSDTDSAITADTYRRMLHSLEDAGLLEVPDQEESVAVVPDAGDAP